MNKTNVSVIIPCYNTEDYIAECLDSVCTQKGIVFEVVVVNDGSTDNSKNIIQQKMFEYPNIIYIEQKNSGLSRAREVGLNKSSGEYIYFVDSDDILIDGAIKDMYNKAKLNNLDCLMINAKFRNELFNSFGNAVDNTLVVSKMDTSNIMTGKELLNLMMNTKKWRYAVWLYFMKSSMLKNNDISYFDNYFHEDPAFNYEMLNSCKKVKFDNTVEYVYRLRKNSLMSNKTSIKDIEGYLNSYNIIYNLNNKKEKILYSDMWFEINVLNQIVESYNNIDEENKKEALDYIRLHLSDRLKNRHNYFVDKYRDLFLEEKKHIMNKETLKYLEIDIVDHCNLNCNDCTHFSNMADEAYMSIEQFEKDIKRLSVLLDGKLESFVIMGGEPLLHKNLCNFMEISRKYFKETNIQVLSNGILISKMDESFFKTCKKYNIQINVTTYPINIDYIKVFDMIINHDLSLFIYDDGIIDSKMFDRYLFDENKMQDSKENFDLCCMAKNCTTLKNGTITHCPIINNISRYNKVKGTNFEVTKDDYLDIYKVKDKQNIFDFLNNPPSFCKYCDIKNKQRVTWRRYDKK